jgi:hypothetical protein
MIKNVYWFHVKYRYSHFNEILIFSTNRRKKKNQMWKFYENPSSGSRNVQTDGRTDMTRLTVALANLRTSLIILFFGPCWFYSLHSSLIMTIAYIHPVLVLQLNTVFHECSTKETEPRTSID